MMMNRTTYLCRYLHHKTGARNLRPSVIKQERTDFRENRRKPRTLAVTGSGSHTPKFTSSTRTSNVSSRKSSRQLQSASYKYNDRKRSLNIGKSTETDDAPRSSYRTSRWNTKSLGHLNKEQSAQSGDTVKTTTKRERKDVVFDIDRVTAEGMVLYKDDDIIALNKPSGLAVHSGPRMKNDLSHFLHYWQYSEHSVPQLAHRLDKDTSGVLLLTRHTEAARRLAGLFQERKIVKKYWAITVNVPDELTGAIQIPLSNKNIATTGNMNRVVLRIDKMEKYSQDTVGKTLSGGVQMALTEYNVLSVSQLAPKRCCLMEVKPVTGFKHQVRVHLADGLMCPILGDHKFAGPLFRSSPFLKKKVEALDCFKTTLHLHAREVVIPNYFVTKGRPLIIKAPLPGYFIKTAKLQGLHL